jgi:uncharacterized repeat protein (TIGR03803 family)
MKLLKRSVVLVLAAILPFLASSQSPTILYSPLHSFGKLPGSVATPTSAPLLASDGFIYGATSGGGMSNRGAIFRVGQDGKQLSVIHSFADAIGELLPPFPALVEGPDGALYGIAFGGGEHLSGAIFKLDKAGTNFSILHSFTGLPFPPDPGDPDGAYPYAGLLLGSDGKLYGATSTEGTWIRGTVFVIDPDGGGYRTLHNFGDSEGDGGAPRAALLEASDGLLYGTTSKADTGTGTIFRISKDGDFSTIYTFPADGSRGSSPRAPLTEGADGLLFGTTYEGGQSNLGTIFSIKTDGSQYSVLHSFSGFRSDGATPEGPLVPGPAGFLYGATSAGGSSLGGVIFSIHPSGAHYTVHRRFALNGSQGSNPVGGLVPGTNASFLGFTAGGGLGYGGFGTLFSWNPATNSFRTLLKLSYMAGEAWGPNTSLTEGKNDTLFGATSVGGTANLGTIYKIGPDGENYKIIHQFEFAVGASGLTADRELGTIYGLNSSGGLWNSGRIFSMRQDGSGFRILHHFGGSPRSDGAWPTAEGRLLLATNGWLFGATTFGGAADAGTIFRLKRDGTSYRVLHEFTRSTTWNPFDVLIEGSDNCLYGTTSSGGAGEKGCVFKLRKDGSAYTNLYSFTNSWPLGALLEGSDSSLYGIGSDNSLFKLNKDGSGYQVIHTFTGWPTDGDGPSGGLVEGDDGYLYGTTVAGGQAQTVAIGTVFRLRKDGSDYSLIHTFQGKDGDGSMPIRALSKTADGGLFGITQTGGDAGAGIVFGVFPEALQTLSR